MLSRADLSAGDDRVVAADPRVGEAAPLGEIGEGADLRTRVPDVAAVQWDRSFEPCRFVDVELPGLAEVYAQPRQVLREVRDDVDETKRHAYKTAWHGSHRGVTAVCEVAP